MHETMTINRIMGLYPETKQVFDCHCVDCPREGADFLDEVAWRHAVPVKDLLRELREAAHCRCAKAGEEIADADDARLEPEEHGTSEPFVFG